VRGCYLFCQMNKIEKEEGVGVYSATIVSSTKGIG
jgi:hypothetical protein